MSGVVFLDRDGTIIVDKHYLCDPALVELEAAAALGLQLLQSMGLMLVVVTNQSGVGRGRFGLHDVHVVNERVTELLGEHGILISGWYMCPHAPDTPCDCRKPLSGMIDQARSELDLDPRGAFVIGDKRSDVELAATVEGTGILVTTGHGAEDVEWATSHGHHVAPDLLHAARLIRSLLHP